MSSCVPPPAEEQNELVVRIISTDSLREKVKGKSVLIVGPRRCGKTTFIKSIAEQNAEIHDDVQFNIDDNDSDDCGAHNDYAKIVKDRSRQKIIAVQYLQNMGPVGISNTDYIVIFKQTLNTNVNMLVNHYTPAYITQEAFRTLLTTIKEYECLVFEFAIATQNKAPYFYILPQPQVEQNELVVRTGLELRLRRLDFSRINVGIFVYIIDDSKDATTNMRHLMNIMSKALRDSGVSDNSLYLIMRDVRLYNSVLDIPKDYRSKGIVVCFREPSYNGRQALYHLFGEKQGLRPYQTFVDVMEKTQKNGDAIVFGGEEVMWFPGPKSLEIPDLEFPENEIQTPYGKREEFGVQVGPSSAYKLIPISLLSGSLKAWVLKTHPETQFVNMGPMMGVQEGMMWRIWGWNTLPTEYDIRNANWDQSITALKPKAEPKQPPLINEKGEVLDPASKEGKELAEYIKQETLREIREIEAKAEPKIDDTKAQLAAIAESLKTLTAAVAALASKV